MPETNTPAIVFARRRAIERLRSDIARITAELAIPNRHPSDLIMLRDLLAQLRAEEKNLTNAKLI